MPRPVQALPWTGGLGSHVAQSHIPAAVSHWHCSPPDEPAARTFFVAIPFGRLPVAAAPAGRVVAGARKIRAIAVVRGLLGRTG